jgi:formylglycine-generating enzyme required for sulfatase activity
VRTLAPNAWGIHDLLGNVWEWCEDGYEPYPSAKAVDPLPTSSLRRVTRGGSFRYAADELRAAARDAASPGQRRETLGLRLAAGP